MDAFKIKYAIAHIMNITGISTIVLKKLNDKYKNKYIRIINYHETRLEDKEQFSKQLTWYKNNYVNVNYKEFQKFLKTGELPLKDGKNLPGVMLTFDDGKENNFEIARPLLNKNGFTGYFMCPSDLIGNAGYMTFDQLKILIKEGHVITDHSATHHRMNQDDSDEVLDHEIAESKRKLEKKLNIPIEIFTWCGGEEEHYTKRAYKKIIESGYKYGFMTNSKPVLVNEPPYNIQRINVEASWPLSLVKFQVNGMMDRRLNDKRIRVDTLMNS